MAKTKNGIVTAVKEMIYFFTSRIFWKNFLQINVLIFFLLFGVFQWLKCYTNHGEAVDIPDFRGQTLSQVKQILKRKHLNIVVLDSMFDETKLPLTILDQTPLPTKVTNIKAKSNRKIYVTVNQVNAPMTPIPNIWDADLAFALSKLANYGLKGREVERKPDRAVNTVLEVRFNGKVIERPQNGKQPVKIPKGSTLELVIADGGGSAVNVPRVTCKTYEDARFLIKSYGLSLGSVILDGTVRDTLSAYVWQQSPVPTPEMTLQIGDQVNVWLTNGLPPGCSTDEDLETEGGFGDGFGSNNLNGIQIEGEYLREKTQNLE